jgi:hypothetical protein
VIAAAHSFHVHKFAVVLSHCRWTGGTVGRL